MSAPRFGSHAPADVSQCVPLPLPVVLTHRSAFFMLKVPVRTSVPWPETVAWADGGLETVAVPSMKTVPWMVSLFVPFHASSPPRDLQEYDTPEGVRSIGAAPAGVALLFRSLSGTPEAVSKPLGKTDAGSDPDVHRERGP